MNFQNIIKIIEKESRILLRNKRILFGLIAPFILLPVLLYGYNYFSERTAAETEDTASNIYIEGTLPEALNTEFSKSTLLDIKVLSDFEEGKDAAIEAREIDLILVYKPVGSNHTFELQYDFGRSSGTRASERVTVILDAFLEQQREALLKDAHITWTDLELPELTGVDLASAEQVSGKSLASILPLILVLYTMMMIINFSVELTTAEKESETLETLLSVPLSRAEMVVGKLFSCILFSVVSSAVILLGMYFMMPLFVDMNKIGFQLTGKLFFNVFATLMPLLFIGSGLSIAVGLFASSYKESGAYSTPLVFLFMIPSYVASTPGIETNTLLSMIPILNATMLIKDALMDQLDFTYFSIAFFVNLTVAVFSLTFMFKVFATEKILFGSGKELSFRLKRKYIKVREHIEAVDVFMGLSIIVILYVNLSAALPKFLPFEVVFYLNQYGVFLLLPILLIWYLKASFKTSFGLKMPNLSGAFSGLFFWGAAFSLSMLYQLAISQYVSEVPTLEGLDELISNWSIWVQFFFLAFTPGICEEMLFRGFALRPLEKALGSKWAIIITALAFAIVHLDFVRLIPTFALGIAFGLVAVKTRSIWPSVVLHILNNSIALIAPDSMMLNWWQWLIVFTITAFISIRIAFFQNNAIGQQNL